MLTNTLMFNDLFGPKVAEKINNYIQVNVRVLRWNKSNNPPVMIFTFPFRSNTKIAEADIVLEPATLH